MKQSARTTALRPAHRSLVVYGVALAISLAIASNQAVAEPAGRSQGQLLRKGYESQVTGERREYFVYLPTGYHTEPGKRWPVILFLHGGGERGNAMEDLDRILVHGPVAEAWIQGRDLPFIMISPQMPLFDRPRRSSDQPAPKRIEDGPPPPRRYGRRPQQPMARVTDLSLPSFTASASRESWTRMEGEVLAMVDATLSEFRSDQDRVYLTGLSFGGAGTWHLAMADPNRWAAVAPICGPGDPSRVDRIADAKLPVWVFQGGRDTVVRPERVLETVVALEAAGHPDVRFTVHEDLGHNVWTRVYEGWDLYEWFLAHRRQTEEIRAEAPPD
ncbi:MAG: alpha/beta hydrolase [Acidobacteriia bacterium]|nr:alpha/beta hydrolase [Terriglobia bacterium]MYK11446.1 alpha/beta hydrolase [Terriglobia bacterium]